MRRDPRTYLWDALRAAELLAEFSSGKSSTDYLGDAMLRSAVERQFEIIGEALNNLAKVSPDLAAAIPDLPRIVAFRNILIHGYASVDDALVWQVLTEKRPQLEERLHQLLAGLG
ncbi:HepT-like ribonuclease domain-containing protein [Lentzea sp. E54]|uniref:HepT-like ribonuclease domain-containing protein n=1 Tax=Lentzea xerophila TaxID=3435883 RepID=UPI003DA4E666